MASTLSAESPAAGASPAVQTTQLQLCTLDDEQLPDAFIRGEPLAFSELVHRYQRKLLSFVYHMIGDGTRAEDIVQEVFLRVYRHIHRFDSAKRFSTWIFTIAANLAKNELRNRARHPLVLLETLSIARPDGERALQFEDAQSRPDDMYESRVLRGVIDAAIQRLAPHHRQVFVLRELEGRPYDEIAQIAGCGVGTVKSRLNRARAAFAAFVEPAARDIYQRTATSCLRRPSATPSPSRVSPMSCTSSGATG